MSEDIEFLDLRKRARELDGQVESLTRQLREAGKEEPVLRQQVIELKHNAAAVESSLEDYKHMAQATIADLDRKLAEERLNHALAMKKFAAQALQDRADVIARGDDALAKVKEIESATLAMQNEHEETVLGLTDAIKALKGSLSAAQQKLPCGHHYSLDDHAGGCALCKARS